MKHEQNHCDLLPSKHMEEMLHLKKNNEDFQKQNHFDFLLQTILFRSKTPIF